MLRSLPCACLLSVSLSLLGCGEKAPEDTREFGTVTGIVTIKGDAYTDEALSLVLMPESGEKGTVVKIGADGTYTTEAVAGANKVKVVAGVGADGNYVNPEEIGVLSNYLDETKTTLTVDVPQGGETAANFEIGE